MIPLRVKTVMERPPDVTKRVWNEAMRAELAELAAWWQANLLPKHFQPSARTRYGYRRRSRKHRARKKALAERGVVKEGGDVDLVFRGLLRESVTAAASVRTAGSKATLRLVGPRYLRQRPKSGQPDFAAELTAVTAAEDQQMADRLDAGVTKRVNEHREPETVAA